MENKKDNGRKKDDAPESGAADQTVTLTGQEYAQLKEQAAKAQETWEKYVRLQADFENARKRMEKERQDYVKFANENLLCDLLTIIDELERSIELSQSKHEGQTAFLKGVEMILAHLHDLLKSNGVCCIDAKGKCFDPNLHEALLQVERNDVPEHTVVEELQKGYMINNRLLRTAKVQVSKKKTQTTEEEDKKE